MDKGDDDEDGDNECGNESDDDASNCAIFNPRRSSHEMYKRGVDRRDNKKDEDVDDANRAGRQAFD